MAQATAQIPRVDLAAQRESIADELDAAIERVLASGRYILGPEVEAFEDELAAYCGTAHCVATGSGTDAIQLVLAASGRVDTGDEVVMPSHTAVPTAFAVELAGARPVFADVDAESQTIDPERAAEAVGAATRALLPVHLYGRCADMDALRAVADKRELLLVEDACQAHGARYGGRRAGALGDAGCFSFYPTKNLGAYGDGGAVVTDDDRLAARLRQLRTHGLGEGYVHHGPAGNSRLDDLQAAILRVKLAHLDAWNEARRRVARAYAERLRELPLALPAEPADGEHVFHLYPIRTPRRDELLRHLRANGVDAAVHYPVPAHLQPPYAGTTHALPVTEECAARVLSLPMYPELTDEQVERVCGLVHDFFERDG